MLDSEASDALTTAAAAEAAAAVAAQPSTATPAASVSGGGAASSAPPATSAREEKAELTAPYPEGDGSPPQVTPVAVQADGKPSEAGEEMVSTMKLPSAAVAQGSTPATGDQSLLTDEDMDADLLSDEVLSSGYESTGSEELEAVETPLGFLPIPHVVSARPNRTHVMGSIAQVLQPMYGISPHRGPISGHAKYFLACRHSRFEPGGLPPGIGFLQLLALILTSVVELEILCPSEPSSGRRKHLRALLVAAHADDDETDRLRIDSLADLDAHLNAFLRATGTGLATCTAATKLFHNATLTLQKLLPSLAPSPPSTLQQQLDALGPVVGCAYHCSVRPGVGALPQLYLLDPYEKGVYSLFYLDYRRQERDQLRQPPRIMDVRYEGQYVRAQALTGPVVGMVVRTPSDGTRIRITSTVTAQTPESERVQGHHLPMSAFLAFHTWPIPSLESGDSPVKGVRKTSVPA